MQKLTKGEYQLKVSVLILAAGAPILYLILGGYKPSLSNYWNTEMQPLFIIANAATSFYLYQIKNWRLSALILLLVTAFSVEVYPQTHNILAIVFFIVTLYPLWITHHFKKLFWIYIVSLGVASFSILSAEIIAVWVLCLHHGLVLMKLHKVNNRG